MENTFEFVIKTDLGAALPKRIDFNFEEIKAALETRLTHYENLIVTKETIKESKSDRAKLNTLSTALEKRRKEIKKLCLAPYEAFEQKCKVLTSMIDEASGAIDAQIKELEDAEREEKRKEIELFWKTNAKELVDILPISAVWNDKWLNKSVSLISVTQEISGILSKTRNDLGIIKAMRLPCETAVLTKYLEHLDMSDALAEKMRYEEREKVFKKLAGKKASEEIAEAAEEEGEILKTIDVRYYDTTAEFRRDNKALCLKHNIRYGGIK